MEKRVLFLLGLVFWLCGLLTVKADLTIWANNGEDKVTRDALRAFGHPTAVQNSVWNGTTVTLFGARNEVVNFNLVLEAGGQDGDYLELAKALNPARVQEIVNQMVPKALWEYGVNDPNDPTWVRTDISWSTNPDVWEAARAELADIIVNQGVNRFYVSGSVTLNGTGIQGVVLNGLPGNPVTNTSGQYIMTVASGWSGTVTPTKAGYSFTLSHRDYSNVTADQTGQDYTASASSSGSNPSGEGGGGGGGCFIGSTAGGPAREFLNWFLKIIFGKRADY